MEFGITSCFRCKGEQIIIDHSEGNIICTDCGEVVGSSIIDNSVDWRLYSCDDGYDAAVHSRNSAMRIDQNGPTVITGDPSVLSASLKKAHSILTFDKDEKQLNRALGMVAEYGAKLKVGSRIIEKSEELLKQVTKSSSSLFRSKDVLVAAVLYNACRFEGFPRSLQEVVQVFRVDKSAVGKLSQAVVSALGPEAQKLLPLGRVLPGHLVERMVSRLHLPFWLADFSRESCGHVTRLGLLDGLPPSTAAAAVVLFVHGMYLAPVRVSPEFLSSLAAVAHTATVGPVLKAHSLLVPARADVVPPELAAAIAMRRREVSGAAAAAAAAATAIAVGGSSSSNSSGRSSKCDAILPTPRKMSAPGATSSLDSGSKRRYDWVCKRAVQPRPSNVGRYGSRGRSSSGSSVGSSGSGGRSGDEDSECARASEFACVGVIGFNPTDSPVDIVSVDTPCRGDYTPGVRGCSETDVGFRAEVSAAFAAHCCSNKRPKLD